MKVLVERDDEIVEVTAKEETERACNSENASKFTQTNDTPAMKERLVEELGFLGNSAACDQMLKGNYSPPEEVDQHTKDLLQALAKPSDLCDSPRPIISKDTFQQGWIQTKERTSAGISGTHLGHITSCFSSTPLKKSKLRYLTFLSSQDMLLQNGKGR